MFAFTLFEYIVSFILEILFQQRWWDYSDYFMNLQGRVCLIFSVLWGVAGLLFINLLHPWGKKKLNVISNKIPLYFKRVLIYSAVIVALVDEFFSIYSLI